MENLIVKSQGCKIDISFVILTWNSDGYIKKCIDSIVSSLKKTNFIYEIFIIDNGSQDSTPDILSALKNKLPKICNPILLDENMGTTYSRNLALKKVQGNFICIMDSDVEIFHGVVEKLKKNLEKNNKIGLTVPKILYPDGKIQKSTDSFPTVARKIMRYFFLRILESKQNINSDIVKPFQVDYAISACWMLKKKVIENIGLLDEKIFYSPEDVDYCLRIWNAGYSIVCDPSISIVHHTQEISRGFKINKAFINHICGLFYYFKKHKYFFFAPKFIKSSIK